MVEKIKLTKTHWTKAAQQVVEIYWDREASKDRLNKVRLWSEVDRQIAMIPRARSHNSGRDEDWLPNTELPLQATALEVLQADSRQLTFPRDNKWFLPHSNLNDSYLQRFQDRRLKKGILSDDPVPMELNQEVADIFVKSTLDHFHRLFNFRRTADAMDISALKYGTYATKVREAELPIFDGVFRGSTVKGPATIPICVKNLYLDNSKDQVTMEGQVIAPSTIRKFWRRPSSIKLQARDDKSFIQIKELDSAGDIMIELLEFEGDLVIPMSRETLLIPNMTIWVAMNAGGPLVIRQFENPDNFRSIIHGTYMHDDEKSPYGSSPLMKGQPIQELATQLTNDMATAAALSARPPAAWDESDGSMVASGGPQFFPGSRFKSDDPQNSVRRFRNWSVGELQAALFLALQQYEDLTGVTAPRRGAAAKSHTTAFAAEVESVRGLVRTDDYVQSKEKSVLEPLLQMEYAIIKRTMKRQPVLVNSGGIEGFANLSKEDLPDEVIFDVMGSSGPLTERQKQDKQFAALNAAAQFDGVRMQQGLPPIFKSEEAIKEILQDAFTNTERFITAPQGVPSQPPTAGSVQGAIAGTGGGTGGT